MPSPEALAAQAEALWPHWAEHLAALAAGDAAGGPAGSETGAQLAAALEALWMDRSEAAGAACGGLWDRVLGR